MLVRVFIRVGRFHQLEDFERGATPPLSDELQVYTWMDATLRELTTLIKGFHEAGRRRGSRVAFAVVFWKGRTWAMRDLGVVSLRERGRDDARTLRALGYQPGDYLDVAVIGERDPIPPLPMAHEDGPRTAYASGNWRRGAGRIGERDERDRRHRP